MPDRRHADARTIHLFAYVQPTDPGMVGAKKGWVDTSEDPPILKVRNNTNDGWISLGSAGSGGAGGGHVIYDEGTIVTQRASIRFEGTAVMVVDDPVELQTVVKVASTSLMTNGDPDDPELVYSDGDVITVEEYG